MSITRSVLLVAKTLIAPSVPAGTIAALATIVPVRSFRVETLGCDCLGHTVRYSSTLFDTTVKFREYPCALSGMVQVLDSTGKSRSAPPTSDGPPSGPASSGYRPSGTAPSPQTAARFARSQAETL